MTRLVLANHSYHRHMTDEGLQLQEGLHEAGWELVGPGYPNSSRDVRRILSTDPDVVFVQDKRDWDLKSGCPGVAAHQNFQYISALSHARTRVAVVVKDGGPEGSLYHQQFVQETGAHAVVTYYHPLSLLKFSPWLGQHHLIRTYHTINTDYLPAFNPGSKRRSLCGSGALLGDVYPFRRRVAMSWKYFGMVWLPHPGYKNIAGSDTPSYLTFLNSFKVSFASSSAYGFSLRKIIESVACGCTVVTDLPSYDILPHIDRAIVRVKPTITDYDLKKVFEEQAELWNEDGRRLWAKKAQGYYNYRASGERLSHDLMRI